jgi:spore germination protein GerM
VTKPSAFRLVLLLSIPVLLTSCQGRTILSEKELAAPRQQVVSANTVWFVKTVDGEPKLTSVKRKLAGNNVAGSVQELLSGPTDNELNSGYGSEIPRGTVLLGVHTQGDALELDLSRRFATGGGITSLETRLEQLSRTVKGIEPVKNVYLNIEGKRLAMIGGEGIEVKQPINK